MAGHGIAIAWQQSETGGVRRAAKIPRYRPVSHIRRPGKVHFMKRVVLIVCAMALMTTGIVGCHASGDIGTNGHDLTGMSVVK
jgi:hypothetical protein